MVKLSITYHGKSLQNVLTCSDRVDFLCLMTWRVLSLVGASTLVRDRMGRTPRQLAIEIRDEKAQGWETSGALHGELDTVIEILLDAEGKATTVCGRDLQKVPGKWSPGTLQKKKAAAIDNHLPYLPADSSSNSVAAKKMMRITELGNALSGTDLLISLEACICLKGIISYATDLSLLFCCPLHWVSLAVSSHCLGC